MVDRDVQAEQAEACQLGPEVRQGFRLGVEQGAGGGTGLVLGQEVGDGLRERAVLFGDGDRHGYIVPSLAPNAYR